MIRVKGVNTVVNKLNKEFKKQVHTLTESGLIKAGIEIRRDMDKTSPTIPIDTGNLRASFTMVTRNTVQSPESSELKGKEIQEHSQFVEQLKTKTSNSNKPILLMGFSANYAVYVHENLKAKFQRPGSGAKFFESALWRNAARVMEILRNELKKL